MYAMYGVLSVCVPKSQKIIDETQVYSSHGEKLCFFTFTK